MRSYLRYWCDAFRLPDWDRERVVGVGARRATRSCSATTLGAGRGVVAALPHMGNWDHAGAWAASRGGAGHHGRRAAASRRSSSTRFVAYRESLGMEVLPLTGGARDVFRTARRAAARRAGWCRCSPTATCPRRGVEVDFFGETARMPPGPAVARAAHRGGAACR